MQQAATGAADKANIKTKSGTILRSSGKRPHVELAAAGKNHGLLLAPHFTQEGLEVQSSVRVRFAWLSEIQWNSSGLVDRAYTLVLGIHSGAQG